MLPLVLGGSGASLDPQGVLEFLHGDYLIVSEGEKSFVALLEALNRGESPAQIPGVAMWRQGEFHLTPPQLTSFPSGNPRLAKWVDLTPYDKMGGSYTIQTKRGCRMRCIYCTYNQVLEGNRLRLRSPLRWWMRSRRRFINSSPRPLKSWTPSLMTPWAIAGKF